VTSFQGLEVDTKRSWCFKTWRILESDWWMGGVEFWRATFEYQKTNFLCKRWSL